MNTPTVPQRVEEDDMMLDPADHQMAELNRPQDGSQSGEDLPLPEGDMELDATKEYLKTLWTPIHESVIVQQYPQAPQAVLCAPAVLQPTQNAVKYEYPWAAHPQGEKRMGPAEWNEWTERKQRVTRDMVVKAGSELLARIDKSQPIPPTAQVAEETVRKAGSLLLAQDESVRDQPVQSVRIPAPASPVPEVHIESIQTKEASTPEVVSQSAVLQPTPSAPETSDQVPLEAAMSVPAVSQPALAAKSHRVRFATGPTIDGSANPGNLKKVATDVVVSGPAVLQRVPATSEPSTQAVTSPVTQPTQVAMDGIEKVDKTIPFLFFFMYVPVCPIPHALGREVAIHAASDPVPGSFSLAMTINKSQGQSLDMLPSRAPLLRIRLFGEDDQNREVNNVVFTSRNGSVAREKAT
ncbi:hypothetical protein N7535_003446 [Penicillium sp. DV-2018c]|nr:hypothetical protein N7535_003446 [Penicillium sp. DV-2018c]